MIFMIFYEFRILALILKTVDIFVSSFYAHSMLAVLYKSRKYLRTFGIIFNPSKYHDAFVTVGAPLWSKILINLHQIRLFGASKEVCNVGFLLVLANEKDFLFFSPSQQTL